MPYEPFQISKWNHVMKGVSQKSARGSCGFSVKELQMIPPVMLRHLFDMFHALEEGSAWPEALVFSFVCCLPKVHGSCTALQIRPLTVLSRLYRCWARYRSTEIAEWMSGKLPISLAGGIKSMCASDICALSALSLETAFMQNLKRAGGVFDIIKCYNAMPFIVLYLMVHLGINPSYVQAYENLLGCFTRTFVFNGHAGTAEHSTTGFPEGCSMAVVAMTCLAYLAHTVLTGCHVEPFVFADNWSFAADSLQAFHDGYRGLVSFCDAFRLQLSPEKSWVWATACAWRKKLRLVTYKGVSVPVLWHAKDLGVDCNFTKLRRKIVWKGRFRNMRACLSKIKGVNLPRRFKTRLAKTGAWAKCTYGAPLLNICASDFRVWRSSTTRALGFNRSGESPMIALNLTDQSLDPQLQDAIHRCSFWRRFLRRFAAMKDDFLEKLNNGGSCDRPVGAFRHALQQFAWQPEGSFLVHPWCGRLDWLRVSSKFLFFALEQTWQRHVGDDLKSTRPGFNISAVDVSGVRASLAQLSLSQAGAVRLYVHGGHYTCDIISK